MTGAQARALPAGDWLRELREVYADDVPGRDLLQHTSADQLAVFGSVEIMPSLPHWHRGRMVAGRRLRARAVPQLGPGRLTGGRKRDRASPLPA
jgi:hypothetical protein